MVVDVVAVAVKVHERDHDHDHGYDYVPAAIHRQRRAAAVLAPCSRARREGPARYCPYGRACLMYSAGSWPGSPSNFHSMSMAYQSTPVP